MRVLLVKPASRAIDFGLAPFFQTEPLGLEYVAAALKVRGHETSVVDLRFERRRLQGLLRRVGPRVVGISCVHVLDADATIALASEVKAVDPTITVIVGGHAASMFPEALSGCRDIDAVALGEGELRLPAICDALVRGGGLDAVPGLLVPDGGRFVDTGEIADLLDLDDVPVPDRGTVARYQRQYCCLNYMPVWTVETARGCCHRCKFCSVWQFHRRLLRFHSVEAVRVDFAATGPNVFIVDDTFWTGRERSAELAEALLASPSRKNWLLVQSRLDTVVDHPDLLELWRPLARNFDVFFGFEAPTRRGLDALHKDVDISKTVEAIQIARKLGFGVTGNFIIDPGYTEEDFEALWAFLQEQQLSRVGFTILTPLPGTRYFDHMRERLAVEDWSHYDLHHLLWQPRLPVQRFFELYCETWRRTVLYLQGQKRWWHWLSQVRLRDVPRLMRILARTQRLMDPEAYLARTAFIERSAASARSSHAQCPNDDCPVSDSASGASVSLCPEDGTRATGVNE